MNEIQSKAILRVPIYLTYVKKLNSGDYANGIKTCKKHARLNRKQKY